MQQMWAVRPSGRGGAHRGRVLVVANSRKPRAPCYLTSRAPLGHMIDILPALKETGIPGFLTR
jgi:hypothetical protein